MALNENITIKLMADTSNYTTKMQAASAQATQLSTSLEKPRSTSDKLKGAFTTAGLAVGALSAAVGVAAVKSFMDFDASMSTVQANTKASASEMSKLRDAALDAGQRTIYSATESADAINELAKAGMSTANILNGGLNGALDLAASDGMAVSDAAELMASTLAQFNLKGTDATKVADALAAGAGNAQGSASDLGNALSQSGLVANQYGVSMQETTGTLAAFANAGMIGSDAGTSLKSMLIALANPSKKAQKALDDLGISAWDSQGNFIGLSGLAGQLQTKMAGLTDQQRQQAMATIFGTDAVRSAGVLYKEGASGIDKWTKTVSDSGYASEQAAARTNNLKGDIEQFSGSIETMLIKIGGGANGPLRTMVQGATDLVTAFSTLDPHIQQTVVLLGVAAGATAGLHKMFGSLSASSSGFGRSMGLVLDPVQRLQGLWGGLSAGAQSMATAFQNPTRQMELFGTTMSRGAAISNGLKSVGSGLLSMMGGPWGIAFAAAGAALAIWSQKTADAKTRTDNMTSALESGQTAAQKLTQNLQSGNDTDWGWFQKTRTGADSLAQALDKAGVSQKTFVDAAMGDKTAITSFNQALDDYINKHGGAGTVTDELRAHLEQQTKAVAGSKEAIKEQSEADKQATKEKISSTLALVGNTGATSDNTDATTDNADATSEAADADDLLKEKTGGVTDAIDAQSSALKAVVDSLKDYYGFAESADEATADLEKSYDDATDAIKENGKTVDAAGTSLDLTTEKGRNNQSALTGIRDAAYDAASAYASAGESTDSIKAKTQQARDNFVRAAQQMGLTEEAAQQLADKYGLIPSKVTTTVLANTDNASSKISTLRDELRNVDGMVVRVTAVVTQQGNIHVSGAGGSGTLVKAAGGYISGPGTATSDSIPARLSNGEYVIRASAVDHYGVGLFDQLNYQRYATGGLVQQYQTTPIPTRTFASHDTGSYTRNEFHNQFVTPERNPRLLTNDIARELLKQSSGGAK
ncbi:MAG: phage tail tape measure protein, partial [Bifidobacterium crudilactis]